jgi:hypothetical protein
MNLTPNLPHASPSSGGQYQDSPLTTEQRLQDIERLLQRVTGYAEFMCRDRGQQATSSEARDKAIVAFHERIAVLEHQLGRIHEDFRLG